MERRRRVLAAIAAMVLCLLIVPTVKAVSLGGVAKSDRLKISPGNSGVFTLLFWNAEEESYVLELGVREKPDDWTVFIRPYSILLNSSVGDEYMQVSPDSAVKASIVEVFVKPDESATGSGEVVISAQTILPEEGIDFIPEIQLKLTVDTGVDSVQEREEEGDGEIAGGSGSLVESLVPEESTKYLFYALVAVCILVISFIIYRYG